MLEGLVSRVRDLLEERKFLEIKKLLPPHPEDNVSPAKDIHDDITDDFCVMSYCPKEGDYCGKCNLSLRGWKDMSSLP